MFYAGQSGFVNVPVCKCVLGAVVACTLFGSIIGSQTRLTLDVLSVVHHLQVWRLITHNFVFTTPGELLFGAMLLNVFRHFERHMGSARYAAFVVFVSSVHTALLCMIQLLFPGLSPASGPYAVIFASVVYFFFDTPKVYDFQLLGVIELSDKTFTYLLALQLLASSPSRSFPSFATAVLAGLLYRIPVIRNKADSPEFLINLCSRYILPLVASAPSTQRSSRRAAQRHMPPPTAPQPAREAPSPVSEQAIETLVAMGFSRDQSVEALRQSGDNVQIATDRLLGGA